MQAWDCKLRWLPSNLQHYAGEKVLNETGAEGWELIGIYPDPTSGEDRPQFICFFKRPIDQGFHTAI